MARWHRATKLDCRKCIEGRRELELGRPDCDACDRPELLPANGPAWEVIEAAGAALFDGMGGVNLSNARQVAEALSYEWEAALVRKINAYAACQLEKDEGAAEDEVDGGD